MLDIYQQLKEIFASPFNQLFTGLSIIVAGDLYKLPSIHSKPEFDGNKINVSNLWHPHTIKK